MSDINSLPKIWKISYEYYKGNSSRKVRFNKNKRIYIRNNGIQDNNDYQATKFKEDIKNGDYFYLCTADGKILYFGIFVSDCMNEIINQNDYYRDVSYLHKSKDQNSICNLNNIKEWAPSSEFTIATVEPDDLYDFEKKILLPYFNLSLRELKMNSLVKELLLNNHNLILHGAPGTGKTYLAKQIASELDAEAELVQFHPSYDYTDFVEGLRPVVSDTQSNTVGFELVDGIFKKFCINAIAKPEKKFVFIIDEINRADVSKVFGELFYCVDPDYRVKVTDFSDAKDKSVITQYSNMIKAPNAFDEKLGSDNANYGHFFIPNNVYIIGTMNDIDRSVETFDFAFRRRFTFVEIKPEDTESMLTCSDNKKLNDIYEKAKAKMKAINKSLQSSEENHPHLSPAYFIGPAYFKKLERYAANKEPFELLWKYHLEGLLQEYLRGKDDSKDILDKLKEDYDKA